MSSEILSKLKKWNSENKNIGIPKNIILKTKEIVDADECVPKGSFDASYNGTVRDTFYNISGTWCRSRVLVNSGEKGEAFCGALTQDDYDNNEYVIFDANFLNRNYHIYTKFIQELKTVVISFFCLNQRIGRKEFLSNKSSNVNREPVECERFYITNRKEIFRHDKSAIKAGEYKSLYKINDCIHISDSTRFKSVFTKLLNPNIQSIDGKSFKDYAEPMVKCFGPIFWLGPTNSFRFQNILNCNSWTKFLDYKEPRMSTNSFLEDAIKKYESKLSDRPYESTLPSEVAYIEKLDDNVCVVRGMINTDDFEGKMKEHIRIYFKKNHHYSFRKNNLGEWVNLSLANLECWNYSIPTFSIDDVRGTKLEYYSEYLLKCEEKERGSILVLSIQKPWLKKIMDSSFAPAARYMLIGAVDKVKDIFDDNIGEVDISRPTVKSMLGLNSYQIKKFANYYQELINLDLIHRNSDVDGFIKIVKAALSPKHSYFGDDILYHKFPKIYSSISSVDNHTFDVVFDAVKKCLDPKSFCNLPNPDIHALSGIIYLLRSIYGRETLMSEMDNILKYRDVSVNVTIPYTFPIKGKIERSKSAFVLYMEYLCMVEETGCVNLFRAHTNPDDLNDLIVKHDSVASFYDRAGSLTKTSFSFDIYQYDEHIENARKYEYNDNDFEVVAPEGSFAVVLEGYRLHNFARNSIKSISTGESVILFIKRTNCDYDDPYYVAEIDKNGELKRIAGHMNYFPVCNFALLEFVKKWCREKSILSNNLLK